MNKKITYVFGTGIIAGGLALSGCSNKGGDSPTGPDVGTDSTQTESTVRGHILNLDDYIIEGKNFDYFLSDDDLDVGQFTEDYLLGHGAVLVDPLDSMTAEDSTVLKEVQDATNFGMNGIDTMIYVQAVKEANPDLSDKEVAKLIVYGINGVADKRTAVIGEAKSDGFEKATGDIVFYNVDQARFAVQLDKDCFKDVNEFVIYKGIKDGKSDSIAAAIKGPGDDFIGFNDVTKSVIDNMDSSAKAIYGMIKKDLEEQANAQTVVADTITFGKDTIYIPADTVRINDTLYIIGLDTIPVDSIPVDTNVVDTNVVDTNVVDTNVVDTNVVDTNVIDTNVVDTPIVVPLLSDSAVTARRNQFCADLPASNAGVRRADPVLDYLIRDDTVLVMLDSNYLTATQDSGLVARPRALYKCGAVDSAKADSINGIMSLGEGWLNVDVDSLVQRGRAIPLADLVDLADQDLRDPKGQLEPYMEDE